ncbi:NAD-dependent epimerase/dehydratase family protein [Rhizobium leguminosarum bv. viciae]|nr:NAD-dependent epimerase/dehydratase family protein [Rhizobium leguminosarum bv. viciae]
MTTMSSKSLTKEQTKERLKEHEHDESICGIGATEMAIMVTGIGFVGAYIVRDLLAAGEDVVVYGLFGGRPGQSEAFPDIENAVYLIGEEAWAGVKVVVGDICDEDLLGRTVRDNKVTGIIHMAGMVAAASEANIPRAVNVNIQGCIAVFETAIRHKVARIVWASSINVFGPRSLSPEGVIHDDSPIDPTSAYGSTKAFVEQIARRYQVNAGLNAVGLRLGKVYGFGEHVKAGRGGGNMWFNNLLENPARGRGGNIVPFSEKKLDFQYVEDVAQAFLTALRSTEGAGDSFLNAGDYRSIKEAFEFVQACLPEADMTLTEGGEAAGLKPGAQTNWMFQFDGSRGKTALGLAPRHTMEDGLIRTINAYRKLDGLPPVADPRG